MIAEMLHLKKSIMHQIVTVELLIRKLCAKLVPRNLNDSQKENREYILSELLEVVAKSE